MNTWQLVAPREMKELDITEENPQEEEAKVKIFNVLLNSFDYMIYEGKITASFPFIPGRYAVGKVVSLGEGNVNGVEKGNRVFIDPFFPDKKFKGDSTPLLGMDSTKISGQNQDGFLTPYAVVNAENLYVLPETVSTENALYTYLIALGVSALDKMEELKGKYIAVVGATELGIILCQLLSYYHAVPILIDRYIKRLNFAKKCGVTYAFLNDENLEKNINDITGGAFADGAVYVITDNAVVNNVAFRVTAPKKTVVFCGFSFDALQVNLDLALKKELRLIGVSNASENISSAINLLANKAVNVNLFDCQTSLMQNLPELFTQWEGNEKSNISLHIIDCYGKL